MMLGASITRVAMVKDGDRSSMFDLHSRYYGNARKEIFYRDMEEKDWVIILRDGAGAIAGFSTIQVIRTAVDGGQCAFLFSGDTVVMREHWQNSTLAGSFCHFMNRMIHEIPDAGRYWLLISKGFRTYRYLPVYFNTFYPVYSTPTPPRYQRLLDHVCLLKYQGRYRREDGVIVSDADSDYLKADLIADETIRTKDPHINFFRDRNPGYTYGNELACIAEISHENFNRRLQRILSKTSVEWYE